MKTPIAHPVAAPSGHGRRRALVVAAGVVLVFSVLVFAGWPQYGYLQLSLAVILERLIVAGAAPGAYLLAAVGMGRLFRPLIRSATDPLPLQVALGLAAMLSLSHLLGWLGLFGGGHGFFVALAIVVTGAAAALHQAYVNLRGGGWEPQMRAPGVMAMLAVAVLVVAACNPPGILWGSEFGGYDALSYHLQVPQEWLLGGHIEPLKHNVYSFLPSYIESAFVHLGAMTRAPLLPTGDSAAVGLVAGEGYRLISCQFLHAGVTMIAAWLVGRAAASAARRAGLAEPDTAASIAFAATLLTPWTIVTGSLAYNDMGVVAFLAAAMLAALDERLSAAVRGVLCGVLIGAACGVKPTALTLAGVPAGIMLLAFIPPRQWIRAVIPGAAAGVAMLAPWLIRNWMAVGNPVFPFAASIFSNAEGGTGHWTAEQVERYVKGHRFNGGWIERLRLLVLQDPTDPAGARHRGMLHPQWGLFFPITLIAAAVAWIHARRSTGAAGARGVTIALSLAILAQAILWLTTTHLQSRFLLPMLAPGAMLIGIACVALARRPALIAAAGAALLTQAVYLVRAFTTQNRGDPNARLIFGPSWFSGAILRDQLPMLSPEEQRDAISQLSAELFANVAPPRDSRLYLLGDATPLYFTNPTVYSTTWDTWPFERAMAAGDNPAAWTAALREQGIDLVLVNLAEIRRLSRSGTIDPRITEEAVISWMEQTTVPIRMWPDRGQALVSLLPPLRGDSSRGRETPP